MIGLIAGIPDGYKVKSEEDVTIAGSSTAFTTIPADCIAAFCRAGKEGVIRVTSSGNTPTASKGFPVLQYETFLVESPLGVAQFRAIREGSTSVTLSVLYLEKGLP